MKPSRAFATMIWTFWTITAANPSAASTEPAGREVAITIDDLPAAAASMTKGDAASITAMTSKLLAILRQQNIPAVGFVNEQKLYKWGEVDERIRALTMWLDAGFELGNHTFTHLSLNQVGLPAFEDDVIQGEPVLRLLLAQHNMKLRYFRHPYLDTGRDLRSKQDVEAFLVARGYRIAPVTLDAWDWMFARVYEDAKERGDSALEKQVVSSYLSYTETVFAFYEQFSKDLLGYEPKQVLLLHANQLNADHLTDVIEIMRRRGYSFIRLEKALSDEAYSLPDTYIGEEGTGWLHHWAITRGQPQKESPEVPASIADRYQALLQLPQQPRPASGGPLTAPTSQNNAAADQSQPSVSLPADLARVLTDYENAWNHRDSAALARLFAEDAVVLADNSPMVRGRAAIERFYHGAGQSLSLRAFAFAAEGSVGFIIGAFGDRPGAPDRGRFTLTLRRDPSGRWLIVSDMDNGNGPPAVSSP